MWASTTCRSSTTTYDSDVLDGRLLVDAHVHVARLPTLSADWQDWFASFGDPDSVRPLFDAGGVPVPQPIEDVLPLVARNPARFRPVANINPHLHYPPARELERQVSLGAVALKVHPVHAGFPANDRMMYPAYARAEERGLPVIVHCGTSTFGGSVNAYADPALLDDVLRDFPGLSVVLAHGGR